MAVPLAVNGNLALVVGRSTASNQVWDHRLIARTTPGRPPLSLANTNPATYARALPITPAAPGHPPNPPAGPPCSDRGICDPFNSQGPGHFCASATHPVPPLIGPPALMRNNCMGGIRPAGLEHHPPGAPYTVCLLCEDHAATQPWYLSIMQDVVPRPIITPAALPPPQPIIGPNAYTLFRTPLCRLCEDHEMTVLQARTLGNAFGMTQAEINRRHDYLRSTCDCLYWVMNVHLCIRDLHDQACKQHDERLMLRQQNDQWLREVIRRPDGTIRKAHPTQIRARARRGRFRACRCGLDIPRVYRPRVLLCMGCEGVFHIPPFPVPVNQRLTRSHKRLVTSLQAGNSIVRLRRQVLT